MSPAALAQGHGLAASTSCARHGKVAEPGGAGDGHRARAPAAGAGCRGPRAGTRAPRRGTARRGAPGTARPAGSAPSRRRPARPWWPSGAAPRTVGRVTSGAPGGSVPAIEWIAVTSSAASSSSGGSSPGSRSASIVLPAPGGPVRKQVVPAGGGHLHRAPAGRLPHDVARGRARGGGSGSGPRDVPGQRAPLRAGARPARPACATGSTSTPSTSAASSAFAGGHDDLPVPGPGGGQDRGQHAADGPHRAVEAELAEQHQPVDRRRRHGAGRGQHGRRPGRGRTRCPAWASTPATARW